MYLLAVCDNSSMLNTILFIKNLINIIFIVVPIILALFFTIDLAKNVFAKDDKDSDRNLRIGVKRIVYSLILLFVPLLIDTFMSAIESYSNVASCYEEASEEKVKELQAREEEEYKKLQEEKRKAQQENASVVEKENEQFSKDSKNAEKEAIKNQNKGSNKTSSVDSNVPSKYIQAKKIAEAAGGGKNCSDGGYTNCPLGDQTGKEVRSSKWRGGWNYVLRSDDPVKANKAAACMEAAVKNDNIGYGINGFSHWYNLWELLKARKDWDVSTVNKKTSVSCCPLVAVCLKYAGFKPSRGLGCTTPSNMKKAVHNAGNFTQVYPGKSLNISNIRRGDVLIDDHHMAMAI